MIVVEAAFGFGHSVLASIDIHWSYELEDLIVRIRRVRSEMISSDIRHLPQRGVLLGLPETGREAARQRLRELAFAFGVDLACLPEPGSHVSERAAELSKRPPRARMTRCLFAGTTHVVEEAVRKARPGVRVCEIDETSLEDTLVEFGWQLAYQFQLGENLETGHAESPEAHQIDWPSLRVKLQEFNSPTFIVNDDALECCDRMGYGYPSPERLFEYAESFAAAAERFGQLEGQLGKRFEDWIMEEYGLEVALFDGDQPGKTYLLEGFEFSDRPHIKVDDHKHGLAQAGRIHFVLDSARHRIMLTNWVPTDRKWPDPS